MNKIITLGAAAGVGALGLLSAAAIPASAATTPNSFISAPTGLHNAPSRQAPAGVTLEAGKAVYAFCFVPDGEKVHGNSTWIRVSVDDRVRGFVPKAAIGGVPALPQC